MGLEQMWLITHLVVTGCRVRARLQWVSHQWESVHFSGKQKWTFLTLHMGNFDTYNHKHEDETRMMAAFLLVSMWIIPDAVWCDAPVWERLSSTRPACLWMRLRWNWERSRGKSFRPKCACWWKRWETPAVVWHRHQLKQMSQQSNTLIITTSQNASTLTNLWNSSVYVQKTRK